MKTNPTHQPVSASPVSPGVAIHLTGFLRRSFERLALTMCSGGRKHGPAILSACCLLFLAGCQSSQEPMVEPIVSRFYLETRPGEAGAIVELPVSKVRVAVNPKAVLTEYDVASVEVVKVDLGWCLLFSFTPAAAQDLQRMSVTAQGRRLVLTFNDSAVGVRHLDQAVNQEGLLIFVEVPNEDLPPLANRIRLTSAGLAEHGKRPN